jgi:hypothetical protein
VWCDDCTKVNTVWKRRKSWPSGDNNRSIGDGEVRWREVEGNGSSHRQGRLSGAGACVRVQRVQDVMNWQVDIEG